jgi:hypothetical protein
MCVKDENFRLVFCIMLIVRLEEVIGMKANKEIRATIIKERIYSWQVADKLGIHENTFFRRLRKELDNEEKQLVFEAIEQIKSESEVSRNHIKLIKY